MAVKAKARTQVLDQELRRWCIEMALRWPAVESHIADPKQREIDVIARANKIMNWVRGPH